MLDGDHARLMEAALPVCLQYGLALAGGYAVKAHGLVDRPSEDIDFATADTAPMEEIMTALAVAYREAGCGVRLLDVDPRKGHLLVTFPQGETDFFAGPELISLCKSVMDEEFSLAALRDQLSFAASYPDESFQRYGIQPDKIADAKRWALEWAQEIGLDMMEDEPWSDPEDLEVGE